MMIDRPWTGFGWGQAETDYSKKYLSSRLNEGAAIEMNDYLMIGISAGVPAMICFAAYIWLSLKPKHASPHPDPLPSLLERRGDVQATCRAGAIVLLVGFWFDGGLFKLSVATVFWTLTELARNSSIGVGQSCGSAPISPSASAAILAETRAKTSSGSFWRKFGRRGSAALPWKPITRSEIALHWLAGILAVLAAAQTTVYLGTPFLPVNDGTLAVARKCLIQRNESGDFEFLSANAVWRGKQLKVLLKHVRLANYNRQLINWKLDDKMYQDFVLSPVLTGDSNEQLNWRRPLWEEFYPRIRHESSPEDAAKIVMKHLRERVTIATLPNPPQDVPGIWLKQITDEAGFEIIYVAALRSVGVPARLDSNRHAEFWDGNKWQSAPSPSVISW